MSPVHLLLLLFSLQQHPQIALSSTADNSPSHPQLITASAPVPQRFSYSPDWASLDSRPLPPWYDRAKVGIFVHWGVYAVPAFGSEWFWTNWRTLRDPAYVDFMRRNYAPGTTYQQFAADLRAELFNATEWAELFADAGARYVVLTAKHHDGFALWPSQYSFSWNALDVGPHRDVVGELAAAVRALERSQPVHFGLYHSLFEWYHPLYEADRAANFTRSEFVRRKITAELHELVQRYRPEVLWSDGDWEAPETYWQAREFLAWLYSESAVAETVVTNDRWGVGTLCRHGDFFTCSDRFNPGTLQPHKWENAMTLDRHSWGHRANAPLADYLSAAELIAQLVETVSCGGNLLVNVGPNRYGRIEPLMEERLRAMGRWLRTNGAAVYGSRPWRTQNDTLAEGVWYTEQRGGTEVYAMVLRYPYASGGVLGLQSLAGVGKRIKNVTMLGHGKALRFECEADRVVVRFPPKEQLDEIGLAYAWTLLVRLKAA